MSNLTLSKKISQLPPDAKKQALDLVDFLYKKYHPSVDERLDKTS